MLAIEYVPLNQTVLGKTSSLVRSELLFDMHLLTGINRISKNL